MNVLYTPNELQIGIDVGSLNHAVAMNDGFGNIINEFEITHAKRF